MESVNGEQFLDITFFSIIWDCRCFSEFYSFFNMHVCITMTTWTFFSIEVLKLIWVLVLYIQCESSLISTQFFVLNLHGWFVVLSNKFIFFWYYINVLICLFEFCYYIINHLRYQSSIFFCLFSSDIYLSLGISLSCSIFSVSVSILFPVKWSVATAAFWVALFEVVLSASLADCLAWSRSHNLLQQIFNL